MVKKKRRVFTVMALLGHRTIVLINCEIACENDGMNHILKYYKKISVLRENPVSDLKPRILSKSTHE